MNIFDKLDGEILIEIGKSLKQLRKNQKYSQQQLAEQIGVSRRLIGDIEAGKGTSLLIFVKLLKVFDKSDLLLDILHSSNVSPKELFLKSKK